jgi:hypothetical protein
MMAAKKSRAWEKKNIEKVRQLGREYQQNKRAVLQAKKLLFGCVRCGYKKCARALHYHHIDPTTKEFGIGNCGSAGNARIEKELAKCQLLCANCHAEIETKKDKYEIPHSFEAGLSAGLC